MALAWWVETTTREVGRDQLPLTWVALNGQGEALGVVGLGEFDPDERRDRSPWVLGLVVAPAHRGRGIGGQLMGALEAWLCRQGTARAWVATGGRAVDFYQKYGWAPRESFTRPTGEVVAILDKAF